MATPPLHPPPLPVNLWTILSDSRRIIKAHSRHFLGLSVLFLLPLFFSLSAYPAINQLIYQSSVPKIETHLTSTFLQPSQQPHQIPPLKTIIFSLLFTLFTFFFSFLATGSIIYSVLHGFYGRPVKLLSSIKSAFASLFRLVSTCVVSELIISGLVFFLVLVLLLILRSTQVLGFEFDYSSPYFISLCVIFAIVFLSIALYLKVNWMFAYVVVVVESSWGFEPLKRSAYLVNGMKKVALWVILFFGFLTGFYMWFYMWVSSSRGNDIVNIVSTSTILTILMLYNLAATTVFYMYAKAVHGELAGEIAEEFAREYVSLPFDDGKVPHVVSVV